MTGRPRHAALRFVSTVVRPRWVGLPFFRGAVIARQLPAVVPDLEHFRVLERVARVELDPLLERQALVAGAAVVLQAHTPMRRLSENFFVYLARGSGLH